MLWFAKFLKCITIYELTHRIPKEAHEHCTLTGTSEPGPRKSLSRGGKVGEPAVLTHPNRETHEEANIRARGSHRCANGSDSDGEQRHGERPRSADKSGDRGDRRHACRRPVGDGVHQGHRQRGARKGTGGAERGEREDVNGRPG